MLLDKILESFEKFCIQVIIDLVLLPITNYKMFVHPVFAYDYVATEMEKDEEDRFKQYLSPIKLSIYTSVLVSTSLIESDKSDGFASMISQFAFLPKAVIIFLVNNFTAVLFSVILLRINKEEVNSVPFRKFLFSFLYTTVYTSLPMFLFIISIVILGGSLNVNNFMNKIDANGETTTSIYLLIIIFFISVLGLIGFFKLFKSYHHIVKKSTPLKPSSNLWFTIVFCMVQILYTFMVVFR